MNLVWHHCYECTFPALYKEMAEKANFDKKVIDWKSETKKNYLYLSAFKKIIDSMNDNKEKGNEHFKK
jgi:hypothetical protein